MAAASSANRRIRPSGKRRAAERAAALWGKSAPLSPTATMRGGSGRSAAGAEGEDGGGGGDEEEEVVVVEEVAVELGGCGALRSKGA